MTVREYAKSKGVELVGELSRYTYKKDGYRWTCYIDKAGNQVSRRMGANIFEMRTAEEIKKEAEEFNKRLEERLQSLK